MPRAFLITNRRYNSAVDYEENRPPSRGCCSSPERRVSTAEGPPSEEEDSFPASFQQPTSPHSPAHESRSSCPQSPVTMFRSPDSTPPPPATSFRAAALVTVIRQLMHHRHSSPSPHDDHHRLTATGLPPSTTTPPPGSASTDSHSCSECGKRYSTSSNLARHRQTHRSPTDKKARQCPHCSKVYVSVPAFSMHVRTHSQGCRCPYCGKCFSRPWLLQGHVRTHTGEKPFRCPVCAKAFADKSNLRAHVQTHSGSKPFVCARCGKAFALKSYLYKHEESSCMRVVTPQERHQGGPLDLATTTTTTGLVSGPGGIRVGS